MSQTREKSGHDPFKISKVFLFSIDKNNDSVTASLKACLVIFAVASISLVLYSLFTTQIRWSPCPDCSNPARISQTGSVTTSNSSTTPPFSPTNISHIVFGIGGSAKTWAHRKQYSQLWWQPNITRGFVWLDEQPDPSAQFPETTPPYRVSSNWKNFKYSSSQSAVRIARVILDTYRVGLPDARWFVMGDDDTVFFTDNLVTVLRRYDHREMYYIGGNSESVEQNVMHAYDMAFGGGGFAVSYSLAFELVKIMDGCLDRYYYFYGSDQRVWACVAELGIGLTMEPGFHQLDIRGDPYGLLAAHPVAPLVSLHHLDYVKPLFPNKTQMESLTTLINASHLDPPRIIQQSIGYYHKRKWSVSISWGYTVQIYPSLLSLKDLKTPLQTFKTWRSWTNGPFTFNTRPLSTDPCKQPISFYLDSMKEDDKKRETITSYNKIVVEPVNKCNHVNSVRRVVVSAQKMDPIEWTKAPRRQCSKIDSTLKKGIMNIRIRSCKPHETII